MEEALTSVVYKKKIRIYSAGHSRIYGVLFVKFTFTLILSVVTFVVVPAQWIGDVPVWVIGGCKPSLP